MLRMSICISGGVLSDSVDELDVVDDIRDELIGARVDHGLPIARLERR